MEAIARVHTITRTFLQQACLDIEKNGLGSVIQVPSLRKYRNAFGPSRSRIPMLARSSVAEHTGASPILFASNFTQEKRMDAEESRLDKVASAMSLGKTCYSAVLGAAPRNVEPADRPDPETNKRKRTKESPGPEVMANMRGRDPLNLNLNPNFRGTGMWPASFSPRMASGAISLPDRTNSSTASSPANQGSYTKTVSGSSHTSPDIGLRNSAEENRVDLRAFQERISTPIWQSTEETLFAQMAANTIPLGDGDPWGILNAVDLSWDVEGLPAGS